MKADLPQGTLDMLLLGVLSAGRLHGYAIAQRLEQLTHGVVKVGQGSLYPSLHRLSRRGLLTPDWDATATGREARFYSLTPAGAAHLRAERANWRRLTAAVEQVLHLS
jgi:PadR family transcriptional regulator, regulatory protein PadR